MTDDELVEAVAAVMTIAIAPMATEIVALRRAIEKASNEHQAFSPVDEDQPRWISLKQAMTLANRGRDTIIAWAKAFELGHKLPGGQSAPWVINEVKLRRHLARRFE